MNGETEEETVIVYRGNNPIANPPNIRSMIVEDLGYCCPWVFFQMFRRTSLIATRLGVAPRSVRMVKARCDNGEETCTGVARCMKKKLKLKP